MIRRCRSYKMVAITHNERVLATAIREPVGKAEGGVLVRGTDWVVRFNPLTISPCPPDRTVHSAAAALRAIRGYRTRVKDILHHLEERP